MLDWRIYYADGRTFSNEDGKPEVAPRHGVLVVPQLHARVGRQLLTGDFYCWIGEPEAWWLPMDLAGKFDYDGTHPGFGLTLFGRYVPDVLFEKIFRIAHDDDSLPRKSAWLPGERGKTLVAA